MERLYTPWRKNYILGNKTGKQNDPFLSGGSRFAPQTHITDSQCVFCQILHCQDEYNRDNLMLCRWSSSFLLLNRYPYNSGHLMVLPNDHIRDITDLKAENQAELMHLTSYAVGLLKTKYQPMAFNIGINMGEIAGGSISGHLHIHIVPRWQGDTNFMPIIGETKTFPEDLAQTYDNLKEIIDKNQK